MFVLNPACILSGRTACFVLTFLSQFIIDHMYPQSLPGGHFLPYSTTADYFGQILAISLLTRQGLQSARFGGAEKTGALAGLSTSKPGISVISGFRWLRKDEGEGGEVGRKERIEKFAWKECQCCSNFKALPFICGGNSACPAAS